MQVLVCLAQRPGEVVRREALLAQAWPRRMVNDEVLSRAIAELRTALGDDARGARYIETVPKAGYRLVAPVAPLESGVPPRAAGEPPSVSAEASPDRPRGTRRAARAAAATAIALPMLGTAWWSLREAPGASAPALAPLEEARPFSSDPVLELAPRFSPDGTRVAFVVGAQAASRIAIQPVGGTTREWATPAGGLYHSPVFFPDGRRLAAWKGGAGDACAIVEIDLERRTERTLVPCARTPRPRFDLSPDGRHLAFTGASRPQYPEGLWLLDVASGEVRALTTPDPASGDDLYPRFSPDSRRVLFFRGNESHRRAWIVERDDPASARALSRLEGLVYGASWLDTGREILLAADWLGFRALLLLDATSGEARLAGARGARFPDVSARGDVVFESAMYSANLWRIDPRGRAAPRELWPSTRYTSQAEFSPDGRQVVFASNRDGVDGIYVAALDGEPRRLLGGEDVRYARPHWSADGRHVYAVRSRQGAGAARTQQAVRIAADGGVEEVLSGLGDAVGAVRETGDGRWLIVAESAGPAWRLSRAPVADPRAIERLPLPRVSEFQVEGDRLVYAQPQLTALTTCGLGDGKCSPLPVELPEQDLYHWALGPRSLYVRAREGGAVVIARYDAAGRRTGTIAFPPGGVGNSIAVSPDESLLLATREQGPAVDLMIARSVK
jgi:DNA-binding winged helix-turn-helix (wHTH) protein/Tol biopolymer transport system component